MATPNLGSQRPDDLNSDVLLLETRRVEAVRRSLQGNATDATGAFAHAERDQLERDIADIERATAALRQAEPDLESWTDSMAAPVHQTRPLWLLIGALWLSTAIVTAGAMVALATLAG